MWLGGFEKFPAEIQEAILTPAEKRTLFQRHTYYKARPQLEFSDEDAAKRLKAEAAKRYQELDANLSAYDGLKTDALPLAQGMVDHSSESPKTYILVLGNYNSAVEEGGGAKVK
ncbi:MAG: hypothetical protein NZV14_15945 [Bryobacteraceae bacterium]|nr:hypothetical protein [Bryobacteraceae bacterium]MDW8379653.1 hypothetical protein [Bryobacterales bacterium]